MAKVHPLPPQPVEASTVTEGTGFSAEKRATIIQDVKDRLCKMVDYLNNLSDNELVAAANDLSEWEKLASLEMERRAAEGAASLAADNDVSSVVEELPSSVDGVSEPVEVAAPVTPPASTDPVAPDKPAEEPAGTGANTADPPQVPSQLDPLSSANEGPPTRLEFQALQADVSLLIVDVRRVCEYLASKRSDFPIA